VVAWRGGISEVEEVGGGMMGELTVLELWVVAVPVFTYDMGSALQVGCRVES